MNIILGSVASSINVSPVVIFDTDALNYIQAVEVADGQVLEDTVKTAINTFVVGLKTDGIWSDITACGILAGARTLSGALVPLKGPQPTNFNFVAGDYSRSLGLSGDGLTKYIDTNEPTDSRPLTSSHASTYMSKTATGTGTRYLIGTLLGGLNQDVFTTTSANLTIGIRRGTGIGNIVFTGGNSVGFKAGSRFTSNLTLARSSGVELSSGNSSSTTAALSSQLLFAIRSNVSPFPASSFSNAGITFYSVGSATDIRRLEARVVTFMQTLSTII